MRGPFRHTNLKDSCINKSRASLPFEPKRVRGYQSEFGASGNRLGCKFAIDDGSMVFVHESEITHEIEQFITSLGEPTALDQPHSLP